MAQNKKRSRGWMTFGAVLLIAVGLAYAFWPRPLMVDLGEVARAPMVVSVNEEGRTKVREAYVVSTPIAGRLMRVQVEPGDQVVSGETVIARMLPTNPEALDIRSREQARADVSSAEAALRVAQAEMNKAMADKELADSDLVRTQTLFKSGTVSQAALDRAEQAARSAQAALDTARAAISMRIANLDSANARLISFNDPQQIIAAETATNQIITIKAPVTGSILRVIQVSETTLPAGTPILEIGDISNDLEIVVELLSTDAVKVEVGNRVIIDDWGGQTALSGVVHRIEPWGFTKFSALGVEEQRVNAVIRFTDPKEKRDNLGHGFRVEVRIVIWEDENALTVPSSGLFRDRGNWAVFVVQDGKAVLTPVEVGHNNGVQAELLAGMEAGAKIILYPGQGIVDGSRVEQRTVN
ncbi:MAG: HlyD family efflux transporter periplasmic adaptor subunit [Paracoccaceae bacterium]